LILSVLSSRSWHCVASKLYFHFDAKMEAVYSSETSLNFYQILPVMSLNVGLFFTFRVRGIVDAWRDNHVLNFYNKYLLLLECIRGKASFLPPALSLSLNLMLLLTVSRPVCLGIKHTSGAYDQIFITVRHLRVSSCGALSLTRGRVCFLYMLLVLASAVFLGSVSLGTRDHILLSQIWDFLFVTSYDVTVEVFDPASSGRPTKTRP
jgi:hypothetical protein